jgi:protein TonB
MIMASTGPTPNPGDRFALTLAVATLVHVGAILGVSFGVDPQERLQPSTKLDIVLVQSHSPEPPEKAQVLAQANQQASGRSEAADRPANPVTPLIPVKGTGEAPVRSEASTPKPQTRPKPQVVARKTSAHTVAVTTDKPESRSKNYRSADELLQRSLEIARLSAQLEDEQRRYAQRPRIHTIDSVSAKSAVEASYVTAWIRKVERVGNLNYPDEARRRKLGGALILNVLIDNDGKVLDIELATTSKHAVLDAAAKRIVELASPFAPFPQEMRNAYDQLMITRTWVFFSDSRMVTK